MRELIKRIDALLKERTTSKRKQDQRKAFSKAHQVYKNYRKDMLSTVKKENKEIKRKALAKIRKMNIDNRPAARKALNEQLKKREKAVKDKLPSKITPEQLQKLVGNRTIKI